MTNLSQTIANFQDAWQRLGRRWEDTRAVWNDPIAWHFVKEYWDVLEPQVPATQREMEHLAQVIAGAKRSVK
ncbi:MAG: hypothetical protein ONB06_11080 [candidate division KSB1 bacterium]|nr:hypothetical protein [candidate division KSB1 bacterium]